MKMFVTGDEFEKNGVKYPGIPFLVDQNMQLLPAPNQYLRYVAITRGRTSSPKTWLNYGNHLYEYFAFLEANNLSWDCVNTAHIAIWRDSMLERGCKRSTVNLRLRGVHLFYQWAQRSGLSHALPFDTDDVFVTKPRGFLSHLDASGGRFTANELTLQTHKAVPKFLHQDKAIRFLETLSPHRLKLMGYLMVLTGMRREEVAFMDYRVVPNPAGHRPDSMLNMELDATITPTKGSKTRVVKLPYDLGVALWDYLAFSRPKLAALFKRSRGRETTRLFLSEAGQELSIRHLNNSFAYVSRKTGIHCTPHMLRHTYGTYELIRMISKVGESKALLWVRDRMGHSSVTTTEKYIHAADLARHDGIDGYQTEICEALRRGYQP